MTTPIGPDYASIDGNAPPDFNAAKRAGARFAIPRAVYGRPITPGGSSPFLDPVWMRDKNAILAAGLIRSAYLFVCYPKHGVYTPPPEEQAQAFIDYVQLTPNQDFAPAIDVEEDSSVLTASEQFDWTLQVAEKIRNNYGAWPLLYTSARVWIEVFKDHSPGPLLQCPLWIAKPWPWLTKTPAHLDGALAYSPTTIAEWGRQWFMYQYQGDAINFPGFDKTVDISRFRVFGKGATGAHVVWVQHRLGITADGIYGKQTEAAVRALQLRYGLSVDGIVGPQTFTVLCWVPVV